MDIQYIKDKLPEGMTYPCSVKEIKDIILKLPAHHVEGIKRIRLSAQRGINADASYVDGIITIYAVPSEFKLIYPIKPTDREMQEYCRFGAKWENMGEYWFCYWKPEQFRDYILYHVLLHEIGHHMDEHHKKRSSAGKESFAENYANEMEMFLKKI
jgi:hypothetical protein